MLPLFLTSEHYKTFILDKYKEKRKERKTQHPVIIILLLKVKS